MNPALPGVTGLRAHCSSPAAPAGARTERLPCPVPTAKGTGSQGQRRARPGSALAPRSPVTSAFLVCRGRRDAARLRGARGGGAEQQAGHPSERRHVLCPQRGPEPEAEPGPGRNRRRSGRADLEPGPARTRPGQEGRGRDVTRGAARGRPGAILG